MRAFLLAIAALAIAPACKKKAASAKDSCPPSVAIRIAYPGASPLEVEHAVVRPVEAALADVPGGGDVHAMAAEGRAVFEIEVAGDAEAAAARIRSRLERITGFPEDVEAPSVRVPAHFERLVIGSVPLAGRVPVAVDEIVSALREVAGVERVYALGQPERETQIRFDAERLAALGVDADALVRAARAAPGDLETQVVATRPDGTSIAIGDVASVVDGYAADAPVAFAGGKPAVVFVIAVEDTPDPAALRAAGLDAVSRPISASICPRVYGVDLATTTAIGPPRLAENVAPRLGELPAVVLGGADLLDRGGADTEIIALGDSGADVDVALREIPGLEVYTPARGTAFVEVTGEDLEVLERLTDAVYRKAASLEGVSGVRAAPVLVADPSLQIKPDRERLAALGLSALDVSMALRRATAGEIAAIRTRRGSPVSIRVIAEGASPRDPAALRHVILTGGDGQRVRLADVASITAARERRIYRRNGKRRRHLAIAVSDRAAARRLEAAIEELTGAVTGVSARVTTRGL